MPLQHNSLRILFAWPGLSGFYGPCWRFLQEECGAKLKCISANSSVADSSRPYNAEKFLHDIDVVFPPLDNSFDSVKIREDVLAFAPDIMFITGWSVPVNRFLATDQAFIGIKKVMCFDMPWQLSFRKIAARFVLARYLRNFDAAFVPGQSTARYARWLGFGGKRPVVTGSLSVNSGFYKAGFSAECGVRSADLNKDQYSVSGVDSEGGRACRPATAAEMEQQNSAFLPPPSVPDFIPSDAVCGKTANCTFSARYQQNSFLYVGRYSPEKGVDILAEAYRLYRANVDTPWRLDCVGAGIQAGCLADIPGITDFGFKQPEELPEIYSSHTVFLLPSRSESWGVAMAEAAACGLPVICTDACGGRFDLVRESGEFRNGIVTRAGSAASLASAMEKIHKLAESDLIRMSANSRKLAEPYSVPKWADRVLKIVTEL